jgi:hypothetical protein
MNIASGFTLRAGEPLEHTITEGSAHRAPCAIVQHLKQRIIGKTAME